MIASSAALFAVMATIASGQQLTVLHNAVTRDQAIAACANNGLQLAAITGASIEYASGLLPSGVSGWIASWNSDNYGGACLQLKSGTITAAASCHELHLPVCEGHVQPQPPSSSSSSSSYSSSSSTVVPHSSDSSSSADLSSSSESDSNLSSESWTSSDNCDSSSSFACSDDVSSDVCSSSFTDSSSSSSRKCDPCCAGVRKLTYQAPFGAGIYLAKVTQRFTVLDVFGPNACSNVASLAGTLGVNAVLVGSNGLNYCNATDPVQYGTKYVVSRAWALNQPIYALLSGQVSAANSLYNCYAEYRAIYITKPLSELTFVNNDAGKVCYEGCKDKPKSCLATCASNFGLTGPRQFKLGN